MSARALALLLSTLLCAGPTVAGAQTSAAVDEGWAAIQEARFEEALSAFDSAEASMELPRSAFVRLLEGRAHVHFALTDGPALDAALRALASVSPEHRFAPETPPELVERFAAVAQSTPAASIRARVRVEDRVATLDAALGDDPAHLVRDVVVGARLADGEWQLANNEPLLVALPHPDARLEYFAEARGPGGARIAQDGSTAAPLRVGAAPIDSAEEPPWLWIGLSTGLGAAVLIAVITGIAVSQSGPSLTQPSPPQFP